MIPTPEQLRDEGSDRTRAIVEIAMTMDPADAACLLSLVATSFAARAANQGGDSFYPMLTMGQRHSLIARFPDDR